MASTSTEFLPTSSSVVKFCVDLSGEQTTSIQLNGMTWLVRGEILIERQKKIQAIIDRSLKNNIQLINQLYKNAIVINYMSITRTADALPNGKEFIRILIQAERVLKIWEKKKKNEHSNP